MIDPQLPADTQAILLLCGYFGHRGDRSAKPLTLAEYNRLASVLHRHRLRPADLVESAAEERIRELTLVKLDADRIVRLLGRGVEMGFAVEEWTRQGIWVLSRGDAGYPRILKVSLRDKAPPLLFGAGRRDRLDAGGLGIVGSRDADEQALQFTRDVAARCAREQLMVVSGGAKGVDRAAMQSALDAGGAVLGVLPEGVAKVATSRIYRGAIADGQLTLVSAFHPNARWSAGNAMGRNRHIYAFSHWTLVVSSATKGGTWSGATESLKNGWGRLLVRNTKEAPEGNEKLISMGGTALDPAYLKGLSPLREGLAELVPLESRKRTGPLLFPEMMAAQGESVSPDENNSAGTRASTVSQEAKSPHLKGEGPAKEHEIGDLFGTVWPSLAVAFAEERADQDFSEVASSFNVQVGQLRAWVNQAVKKGYVVKQTRPVRYVVKSRA